MIDQIECSTLPSQTRQLIACHGELNRRRRAHLDYFQRVRAQIKQWSAWTLWKSINLNRLEPIETFFTTYLPKYQRIVVRRIGSNKFKVGRDGHRRNRLTVMRRIALEMPFACFELVHDQAAIVAAAHNSFCFLAIPSHRKSRFQTYFIDKKLLNSFQTCLCYLNKGGNSSSRLVVLTWFISRQNKMISMTFSVLWGIKIKLIK